MGRFKTIDKPFEMVISPANFDGTLDELFEGWVKYLLIPPTTIEEFHKEFLIYLESADPLFLTRKVSNQLRGQILHLDNNARLCPTDNSPAWWIHYQLFTGQYKQYSSFASFIEAVPSHIFQMGGKRSVNKARWHVAHMFDVKDGNVQFSSWDRNELIRRMTRNIHPCNYFYIPKQQWQQFGGDPVVIAYFYDKFRRLYRAVWEDFLTLADGYPIHVPSDAGSYHYRYAVNEQEHQVVQRVEASQCNKPFECKVQYFHPRLCFKADMIEPLAMEDKFCILTNDGTFIMSKREFYETFPNVVKSNSYRENRVYHYPKPPKRSQQFMIDS